MSSLLRPPGFSSPWSAIPSILFMRARADHCLADGDRVNAAQRRVFSEQFVGGGYQVHARMGGTVGHELLPVGFELVGVEDRRIILLPVVAVQPGPDDVHLALLAFQESFAGDGREIEPFGTRLMAGQEPATYQQSDERLHLGLSVDRGTTGKVPEPDDLGPKQVQRQRLYRIDDRLLSTPQKPVFAPAGRARRPPAPSPAASAPAPGSAPRSAARR